MSLAAMVLEARTLEDAQMSNVGYEKYGHIIWNKNLEQFVRLVLVEVFVKLFY